MNSKQVKLIGLAIISVAIVAGSFAYRRGANSPAKGHSEKSAIPAVMAVMPLSGEINQGIFVTGSLVSLDDVEISSKLSGRLMGVFVREGDPVRAGQPLAQLDQADLQAQERSAEAAVLMAKTKVDQAQSLLDQQTISTASSIQSARAALDEQKVGVATAIATAQATLKSANANLSQVREGARKQELSQANSEIAIAQANYDKAASDLKRYKMLRDEDAIAPATYDQYVNAEKVALAELDAEKEKYSLLKEGARSQEITQAEQAVRQAEDKLREAQASKSEIESRQADLASARATKSQIKVRQADIEVARAEYRQTLSSLSIARQALSDSIVRSPITGVVSWRGANTGQVVASGTTILKVVSLNSIRFDAAVPETEIGKIDIGVPVDIAVSAFPNRKFKGVVIRIFPSGSAVNRTFGIRIAVENADGLLRPQMFASGKIATESKTPKTLVPTDSLLDAIDASSHKNRLFSVENGVAKALPVQVGSESDDGQWIETIGAPADYPVVVLGQKTLRDGAKVTVQIINREAPQR